MLEEIVNTASILIGHLKNGSEDDSHKDVTILMLQVREQFGEQSETFMYYFPIMDGIEKSIARSELERAYIMAEVLLERTIDVIKQVKESPASTYNLQTH